MSKYKAGDTFTITIKRIRSDGAYVIGEKTIMDCETCLAISENELNELVRYSEKIKTYEDGLADAWEAARKINCYVGSGGISTDDVAEIFGRISLSDIMKNHTPQEAIAKIKEWEDSKKIKKGDEVRISSETGIVVFVDGSVCDVLFDYGCYEDLEIERISKTGRNFADKLDALLGEIGEKG